MSSVPPADAAQASQTVRTADAIRLGGVRHRAGGYLAVGVVVLAVTVLVGAGIGNWAFLMIWSPVIVASLGMYPSQRRRARVTSAPAVLTPDGFRLRLGMRRVRVSWDDVAEVGLYLRSTTRDSTTMTASLKEGSRHDDHRLVNYYRVGPDGTVWLGRVATADVPMATVLATVRGRVGQRLNERPRTSDTRFGA